MKKLQGALAFTLAVPRCWVKVILAPHLRVTSPLTRVSVRCVSPQGITPLMRAAKRGDLDAVNLLLASKADIDASNKVTRLEWEWPRSGWCYYLYVLPGSIAIFRA